MTLEPRRAVCPIGGVVHGGFDFAELQRLGIRPEDVLDFSANINPYGPAPGVRAALVAVPLEQYPDRECGELRRALAKMLNLVSEQIVVGNGAAELIALVAQAFLQPGDRVLILEPAFGEYARAALLAGAEVDSLRARPEDGFAIDPEAVAQRIGAMLPRLVFLANPNNPTGTVLDPAIIADWADRYPRVLFVVDEAYRSFVSGLASAFSSDRENLLVLQSMTKDFALAGLRLGYAVGPAELIAALARVRPAWNVNSLAQAAGLAALRDPAHRDRSVALLAQDRELLRAGLAEAGVETVPSATHYFLAQVSDGAAFRKKLLEQGLLVRDAASFGLPGYVRIAARLPMDNARLIEVGREVRGEGREIREGHEVRGEGRGARNEERGAKLEARVLMIQGASSSVGKSLLTAALCRIFARRGLRVAPFKAQNMSNNAAVCADGAEIGRAQAVQARAAGIAPTADMNPVLLKPEADSRSQVIVLGKPWQTLPAGSYQKRKQALWSIIIAALARLRADYDLVLIEGAGSPAELNLRQGDVVNMALARHAESPVLLVGDIDRGGIFAQLLGTLWLLEAEERALVRGLIVNKFRGDPTLFADGIRMLEERSGLPVLGVVPFIPGLDIAEEDAVALEDAQDSDNHAGVDIVVIRLPHIANFDDFNPLASEPGVRLRYVTTAAALGRPAALILPGTKSTMADLAWMGDQGLTEAIRRLAESGTAIAGICGGYQMLGRLLRDPARVESTRPEMPGLGLLYTETIFTPAKATQQVRARIGTAPGWLATLAGAALEGYEIHMGRTVTAQPWLEVTSGAGETVHGDGAVGDNGRVWGCYLHGLFGNEVFRRAWLRSLGHEASGVVPSFETSIDRLAQAVEQAVDMKQITALIGL